MEILESYLVSLGFKAIKPKSNLYSYAKDHIHHTFGKYSRPYGECTIDVPLGKNIYYFCQGCFGDESLQNKVSKVEKKIGVKLSRASHELHGCGGLWVYYYLPFEVKVVKNHE